MERRRSTDLHESAIRTALAFVVPPGSLEFGEIFVFSQFQNGQRDAISAQRPVTPASVTAIRNVTAATAERHPRRLQQFQSTS